MDQTRWVLERVEHVLMEVLRQTRQSQDFLLPAMTVALEQYDGVLHLVGQLSLFESIKLGQSVIEEASYVIQEYQLDVDCSGGILDSVAGDLLQQWCCYYLNLIGRAMICGERKEGAGMENIVPMVDDPEEPDQEVEI